MILASNYKISEIQQCFNYRILPVNNRSYYKFQVEIGTVTNCDINIKIVHKHEFMVFNLELCDDYPSAASI